MRTSILFVLLAFSLVAEVRAQTEASLQDYFRGVITRKGKSERFLSMARTKSKPST